MEPMDRYAWKQLAAITALGIAIRIAAAIYWHVHWSGRFFYGDSQGYWDLAQAIAHGRPYMLPGGEQIFRTPGYPLLLAPLAALGNGPACVFLAHVESCIIGALAVPLAYVWTRRLFNGRAGLWAACVAAVYPEAIATNVAVLSDTPLAELVALHLIIVTQAFARYHMPNARENITRSVMSTGGRHAERACYFALAGVVAGLATLVHPSFLLFVPFAMAVGIAIAPSKSRLQHIAFGSITLAALCLIMLPWWIRNAYVAGRFVPTTLQVGPSLYDGLRPDATGGSDMRFVAEFRRQTGIAPGATVNIVQEQQLDGAMRHAALAWAYDHPGRTLQLAGIKLLRMWNIWPNEASFSAWPVRLAVVCSYGPIIVLALYGAWQTRRRGWVYWLCWLPAVYFSLLHVVFVSSLRYRQPAMLGLIVLAAGALECLSPKLDLPIGSNTP